MRTALLILLSCSPPLHADATIQLPGKERRIICVDDINSVVWCLTGERLTGYEYSKVGLGPKVLQRSGVGSAVVFLPETQRIALHTSTNPAWQLIDYDGQVKTTIDMAGKHFPSQLNVSWDEKAMTGVLFHRDAIPKNSQTSIFRLDLDREKQKLLKPSIGPTGSTPLLTTDLDVFFAPGINAMESRNKFAVWNAESGHVSEVAAFPFGVDFVSVSPNGKFVAGVNEFESTNNKFFRNVVILNVTSGAFAVLDAPFKGHDELYNPVFSRTGELLVSSANRAEIHEVLRGQVPVMTFSSSDIQSDDCFVGHEKVKVMKSRATTNQLPYWTTSGRKIWRPRNLETGVAVDIVSRSELQ